MQDRLPDADDEKQGVLLQLPLRRRFFLQGKQAAFSSVQHRIATSHNCSVHVLNKLKSLLQKNSTTKLRLFELKNEIIPVVALWDIFDHHRKLSIGQMERNSYNYVNGSDLRRTNVINFAIGCVIVIHILNFVFR